MGTAQDFQPQTVALLGPLGKGHRPAPFLGGASWPSPSGWYWEHHAGGLWLCTEASRIPGKPQEAESHTPPAGPLAWPWPWPIVCQFTLPRPLALLQCWVLLINVKSGVVRKGP